MKRTVQVSGWLHDVTLPKWRPCRTVTSNVPHIWVSAPIPGQRGHSLVCVCVCVRALQSTLRVKQHAFKMFPLVTSDQANAE